MMDLSLGRSLEFLIKQINHRTVFSSVLSIGISMTLLSHSSAINASEDAQTPEASLSRLLQAANRGDLESFGSQLGGYSKLVYEAGRAVNTLHVAIKDKFGKQAASKMDWPSFDDELKIYAGKSIDVRTMIPIGNKSLALTVWMRKNDKSIIFEQTWTVVWDGKSWKIVLPEKGVVKRSTRSISGEKVTIETLSCKTLSKKDQLDRDAFFLSMKHSCEVLSANVKAGKYAKMRDFVLAFNRIRQVP